MTDPSFAPYLSRWHLTPDDEAIVTPAARLLPVIACGTPAILKIVALEEAGAAVNCWRGGAAYRLLGSSSTA